MFRRAILTAFVLFSGVGLVAGCAGNDPVAIRRTVSGIVISSVPGQRVEGAEVSILGATAGTNPFTGRFEFTGLPEGPAILRCTALGFEDFEVEIIVTAGLVEQDIVMTRIETFEFGDFALYVPAMRQSIRAVLVTLGGPDTRGFASGAPFGAPVPEVETALQTLGEDFRAMAVSERVAVLGTSLAALPNGPDSDALLLDALKTASELGASVSPSTPVMIYGISGGGPQASGYAARNAENVVGLFLKVPASVEASIGGKALEVPTYMVLAGMDVFVDNVALSTAWSANRGAGAPWALALEPGVPHFSLTPAHRALTTEWMEIILEHRFWAGDETLTPPVESAGWLGDPVGRTIAEWADYSGDPRSASWLPSRATAEAWRAFVGGTVP